MKKLTFVILFCGSLLIPLYAFSQDYSSYYKQAQEYFNKGQYAQAVEICEKWLPALKEKEGESDTLYLELIELAGNCYSSSGQYDKALKMFEELKSTHLKKLGKNHSIYATDLNNLADCYYGMGNYELALPLYVEAKNIRQDVLGTKHRDYARSLSSLAVLYYTMGNFESALPLFEEAFAIDKEVLGNKDPLYADDLINLGSLYKRMGKYEAALPLLEESCKINKEVKGARHTDYATSLSYLAGLYSTMGNYEAALPLYLEVKSIRLEFLGPSHPDYARSLNNLGSLYLRMGNFESALPLFVESINIWKVMPGDNHIDYAMSLNNLALLYKTLGNYEVALPLFIEASAIFKEILGNKHPEYATSLNNLALLYSYMGNYEAALPLQEEASAIDKETLGASNPEYAKDLINLVNLYSAMGNDEAALPLSVEASTIYKEAFGIKHPDYALSLNSLARLYQSMGNYEASLPLLQEASSIYREVLGDNHPDYATSIKNLAITYKETGDYKDAFSLMQEASTIYKEVLGPKQSDYALSLKNLSEIYIIMGNYKTALPLLEEANMIINLNIQENFSFITEDEKKKYFRRVGNIYDVYLSLLKKVITPSPEFCGCAYDNELLLKGLILSSVTAMQQAILESGDTSLTKRYEQMRMLKSQIIYWQQKPISERRADLAVLEQQAYELEKDLTRRSQAFGEMQASFGVKWKDVQKQLKKNEAAVEFVSFRYYSDKKITDSTFYCALVVRSSDIAPHIVPLCEESQLKKSIPALGATFKDINSSYHEQALYKLVWQPLDSLLGEINTVYFAPSGLLNSVSMAAISSSDNKLLMEKYRLVQLSSTRTLALPREPDSITNAVVYGGIIYDTDTLTLLSKAEKYHKKEGDLVAHNRSIAGDNRSGFRYLSGTLKEAEMIAAKLEKNGIATITYSGTDANEESFVSLSGKSSPSIIHLSTHGFYYPDTMSDENHKQMMPSTTVKSRFRYSDDPLLRSGLLMAGANRAWNGLPLPPNVEDGILTAKEVSNMNLMNTQLVVLSACQTGQGDVKGSEGVEGLQRGFKMAGAKYLVMSLWEVPDKETTEFMDMFYGSWLGGQDMHEAFRTTQAAMSNKYKNEPFKWAAFVMVE